MSGPPPFRSIDAINNMAASFTTASAADIICAVNGVGAGFQASIEMASILAQNLNGIAVIYAANDYQSDLPNDRHLARRLRQIESQCAKLEILLDSDGTGVGHDLGPGVLWKAAKMRGEISGEAAVADLCQALRNLRKYAAFAASLSEINKESLPVIPGPPPNMALAGLINDLGETFEWLWEREPGRSIDRMTETPGKFPVLVMEVLNRIAPNQHTAQGIDGLIRRHLNKDRFRN